jgi:hypothetical protein
MSSTSSGTWPQLTSSWIWLASTGVHRTIRKPTGLQCLVPNHHAPIAAKHVNKREEYRQIAAEFLKRYGSGG